MAQKKTYSPKKKDKALEIALNLLGDNLTVRAIHDQLTELIDYGNIQKIACALDPKADALEELTAWINKEQAIRNKLDEEGKKLFSEYDNDWSTREFYRAIARFYLGFAAGMKLSGVLR